MTVHSSNWFQQLVSAIGFNNWFQTQLANYLGRHEVHIIMRFNTLRYLVIRQVAAMRPHTTLQLMT